jgi:hypothetical protein
MENEKQTRLASFKIHSVVHISGQLINTNLNNAVEPLPSPYASNFLIWASIHIIFGTAVRELGDFWLGYARHSVTRHRLSTGVATADT